MFGIGSTELLLILVVALVVLGPRSLAGFARTLGKFMGEFRRVSTEFQRSLNVETAREEAREAEAARKKKSAESAPGYAEKEMANPAGQELASMDGLPPDSPVARELARARAEAEAATQSVRNVEKELENSRASKDAAGQGDRQ